MGRLDRWDPVLGSLCVCGCASNIMGQHGSYSLDTFWHHFDDCKVTFEQKVEHPVDKAMVAGVLVSTG